MVEIEAVIGKWEMSLIVSERLAEIISKTNSTVNYRKRVAQMRRCYYGEINDSPITFSPSFIFGLEEVLDEEQYYDVLHKEFFNFPRNDMAVFYSLFREGRSIYYSQKQFNLTTEEIEEKIQKLFTALSKKIRYEHEEVIVE